MTDSARSLPPVAWVVAPVALGTIPAGIYFALTGGGAAPGAGALPLPDWAVVLVWIGIYGGMGRAAWWANRDLAQPNRAAPLALLTAGAVQSWLFWVSPSLAAIALTDAAGVVLSAVTFLAFRETLPQASLCLLPWVIWMPLTLAFKLVALAG